MPGELAPGRHAGLPPSPVPSDEPADAAILPVPSPAPTPVPSNEPADAAILPVPSPAPTPVPSNEPADAAILPVPSPAPQAPPVRKLLWTVDASLTPSSPVSDVAELTSAATAAVQAGDGHVLSTNHVIFPNAAVTLVLILAESHLAIHTWPEENLIAVDLFSCGAIAGGRVVAELVRTLQLAHPRVQQLERGEAPR